jgi:integrase
MFVQNLLDTIRRLPEEAPRPRRGGHDFPATLAIREGDPPIGSVMDYYIADRFAGGDTAQKSISPSHARRVNRAFAVVELRWGRDARLSSFDHKFIDAYVTLRTTEEIEFPPEFGRRTLGAVSIRHAFKEAKAFTRVISYAKRMGKIAFNPLEDYPWVEQSRTRGDVNAVRHNVAGNLNGYAILMGRPKLIDSDTGQRFEAPVHRVPTKDGGARLRCSLAFLFHHGCRVESISKLRCDHVAFTAEESMALLDRAPNCPTWWAEHFPNGGVLWPHHEKSYIRFTPFSRWMSQEIQRWKAEHPCWEAGMPLFPMYTDPSRAVPANQFRTWMYTAHEIARADQRQLGVPEPQIDRWLGHAVLYGWRIHWKSLVESLGYGSNAVDWMIGAGTMKKVFDRPDPRVLQAIMDFEPAHRLIKRICVEELEWTDVGREIDDNED